MRLKTFERPKKVKHRTKFTKINLQFLPLHSDDEKIISMFTLSDALIISFKKFIEAFDISIETIEEIMDAECRNQLEIKIILALWSRIVTTHPLIGFDSAHTISAQSSVIEQRYSRDLIDISETIKGRLVKIFRNSCL